MNWRMVLKYAIAGLLGVLVQTSSLYLIVDVLNIWYIYGVVLAFIIALIFTFTIQKIWTFRDLDYQAAKAQIILYTIIALGSLALNVSLMYFLVSYLKFWYLASQLLVSLLTGLTSFILNKTFTFGNGVKKIDTLKPILFLFICSLVLTLMPIFHVVITIGDGWQGVPLNYVSDAIYYYARIAEVADGYPSLGNPYFIEHKQELAPAFFIPDWLAAAPIILGLSVVNASIFNFFLWTLITLSLLYWLLRILGHSRAIAATSSVFAYLGIYLLMIRPAVMQTVFAFFLLFLIATALWLKNPQKKLHIFLFIFSLTASFYVYSYLWQIALVVISLILITLVIKKEWGKIRNLLYMTAVSLALTIPYFLYFFKQLTHPLYWETMSRIGLVSTHLPGTQFFYWGRWVIVGILLLYLINYSRFNLFFFSVIGAALLIASGSYIITGKDLELVIHINRYIILWSGIIFGLVFYDLIQKSFFTRFKISLRNIVIVVLFFSLALFSWKNILRSTVFLRQDVNDFIYIQNYAQPLNWLEDKEKEPVAIWANDSISFYIPTITKHYVLTSIYGMLHLLSSEEVIERYLISHYFDNLNVENLEHNFALFAGGGAQRRAEAHNRYVKLCQIFYKDCGEIKTESAYQGREYFEKIQNYYEKEVVPNIKTKLSDYNIAYAIKDKQRDFHMDFEKLGFPIVYEDDKFAIYKVTE